MPLSRAKIKQYVIIADKRICALRIASSELQAAKKKIRKKSNIESK